MGMAAFGKTRHQYLVFHSEHGVGRETDPPTGETPVPRNATAPIDRDRCFFHLTSVADTD
jgi:hypothetical protein